MKLHITSLPMRQFHKDLQQTFVPSLGLGRLDKLHLQCQELSKLFNTDFILYSEFKSRDYECCGRYFCPKTRVFFSILSKPRRSSMNWEYQLQINPRDFKNMQEFLFLVRKIIGDNSMDNHLIQRIDSAIVFDSTKYFVEWCYYILQFKWKRRSEEYFPIRRVGRYRGKIESFSIGRNPFRLQCYIDERFGPPGKFKIELQIGRHKRTEKYLPQRLDDLPELLKINPFQQLKFLHPYGSSKRLCRRKKRLFKRLREEIFRRGLQGAKPVFNKWRNANRDLKDLLKPVTISKYKIPFEGLIISGYKHGIEAWMFHDGREFFFLDDQFDRLNT